MTAACWTIYSVSCFFQAEDGIRDYKVTGVRRVLFRSSSTGVPAPCCAGRSAGSTSASSSGTPRRCARRPRVCASTRRSEEHTSELQSPCNLVCRLLLEKKNKQSNNEVVDSRTE